MNGDNSTIEISQDISVVRDRKPTHESLSKKGDVGVFFASCNWRTQVQDLEGLTQYHQDTFSVSLHLSPPSHPHLCSHSLLIRWFWASFIPAYQPLWKRGLLYQHLYVNGFDQA